MKAVRDTNSEPGLPVLRRGLPVEYSYSIKNSCYLKMCISQCFFTSFILKKLGRGDGPLSPSPCASPVKANGITTHYSRHRKYAAPKKDEKANPF